MTVFDAANAAGGSLRKLDDTQLPKAVLDREIVRIAAMGVRFASGQALGKELSLPKLRAEYGAVLLATGEGAPPDLLAGAGLAMDGGKLHCDTHTRSTSQAGVFAAGSLVGRGGLAIRAVADGLAAAQSIVQHLAGAAVTGRPRLGLVRYGPLEDDEQQMLWSAALADGPGAKTVQDNDTAAREAQRCLICGCQDNDTCRLRQVAGRLAAKTVRFVGARRRMATDDSHPLVTYQSHKCILCGVCVQIAQAAGEKPGLTFIGRGFDERIGAPYEAPWSQALGDSAGRCADACPTSAIVRKRDCRVR